MPDKNENPTDTIARLEAELAQLRADYSTLKRNYERLQHTVKASNPLAQGASLHTLSNKTRSCNTTARDTLLLRYPT